MVYLLPVFTLIVFYFKEVFNPVALSPALATIKYSKENYLLHGGFSVKACLK